MKKTLLILLSSAFTMCVSAQLVAKMEVKEDIPGICDKNEVYALFPSFEGQIEAICPLSETEIANKLNTELQFLKDNPKYKDKGMVSLIINCSGQVVQCRMGVETKSPELDYQILAVFNNLQNWKPGKLYEKEVDSSILYSFKIKKGILSFE